jgi:signal transduction histidine kinase
MLGTGMVLAASGVAGFAVSRGLAPMHRVTQTLGEIDETRLDARVPTGDVPLELRPFVDRLNRLLTRLDDAFTRERQFSSDVAHELRTPLAVLRASIDLALSEQGLDVAVQRRLQDMLVTIDETAHLVDDLLELARTEGAEESGDLTHAVDLHDMVDVQWQQVQAEARARGLSFENAIVPATYVESDPTRLRRIVANLLSNAAAYTEENGWVRVESDVDSGRLLAVRDSGPPIPAEQRDHLFERFWRADAARTETGSHAGIGLALARAMARRLGHDLEVEIVGSEVCFVLTADEG